MISDTAACHALLKKLRLEAVKAEETGKPSLLLKEQFSEIERVDETISQSQMLHALIKLHTDN